MEKEYLSNYVEEDVIDFKKLNALQLDFVNLIVEVPAVIDLLKDYASNLSGSYKYYKVFYGTRKNKKESSKDRVKQEAALASLKLGSKAPLLVTLRDHKLKLEIQKEILPALRAAQKSEDEVISESAKKAVSLMHKLDATRGQIIMNKQFFVRKLAKTVYFNCDPEEVEQIGMMELVPLVERYNLDESTSFASNIRMRLSHVLRRSMFDESNDALNKNPLSLQLQEGDSDDDTYNFVQVSDESQSAINDYQFDQGMETFRQLIASYPKQKKYIATQYYFETEETDIKDIAKDIGYKPQYVYKVIQSIEEEFKEKFFQLVTNEEPTDSASA